MSKHLTKQKARLERRQRGTRAGDKSTKLAGSMNPRKSHPTGQGRRSTTKVKQDSRDATL